MKEILYCILLSLLVVALGCPNGRPVENLRLTPVKGGLLLSEFEFEASEQLFKTSTSGVERPGLRTYALVPGAFHRIFERFPFIEEVELTLTQGSWRQEKWGKPPRSSYGPIGLFLRIKHNDTFYADFTENENLIISSISDLLSCGTPSVRDMSRHASLGEYEWIAPREGSCTDNLMRIVRYLPGWGKTGLSSLLVPSVFYKSHYNSISITISSRYGDIVVKEGFAVVLPREIVKYLRINEERRITWKFPDIFLPKTMRKPFVKTVIVESSTVNFNGGDKFFLLSGTNNLEEIESFIQLEGNDALTFVSSNFTSLDNANKPADLSTVRRVVQEGDIDGYLMTRILNELDTTTHITSTDFIPYPLRFLLNTLEIWVITPTSRQKVEVEKLNASLLRQCFQFEMDLPPKSEISYSIQMEGRFLHIEDYPPDVEGGVLLPGSLVKYRSNQASGFIHSAPQLVTLPLPDFSMYFNVIVASITVLMLFFGNFISYFGKAPGKQDS